MKRSNQIHSFLRYLVLFIFCCTLSIRAEDPPGKKKVQAKTLIRDARVLDINNIDCYVLNDGSVGENPQTGETASISPPASERFLLSIPPGSGCWAR